MNSAADQRAAEPRADVSQAAGAPIGDIAIVGMACLFPGAANLHEYWQNILDRVCAIDEPPPDWEADKYRDLSPTSNDRTYCTKGGYLRDLAKFDPLEFGVMPKSLDGGEPDHYLTLRVAHEALVDAGYSIETVDPEGTEVILGRGTYINRGVTSLYQHSVVMDQTVDIIRQVRPDLSEAELAGIKQRLKAQLPPFNVENTPAMIPNILAGRIANRLNLMGANYIVDAACASSLVAVELGMSDLIAGKCDLAIVGGINASIPPPTLMIFSQLNALSRSQSLRAFDVAADGTLLGEGLGVVVLKRRRDAERDGNRIYAVIKGVGLSSDGRAQGLLAPRTEGQVLAIRRAYERAGVAPESIELIEAHGTGTRLGDATEMHSLTTVFGQRKGERATCGIGSVKTNLGHLLTAAGMAGLIKVALALHHKVLPPMIGGEQPNPDLKLDQTPFYLSTAARPWVHGDSRTPRRGGVNAFGFGGINSHAILEEWTGPETPAKVHFHRNWEVELFLLRGAAREELVQEAQRVLQFLEQSPETSLTDLAYTLNVRTGSAAATLAIVSGEPSDLRRKLEFAVRKLQDPACRRIREKQGIFFTDQPLGPAGQVAFLFPGEGSQYPNMLADLCLHFPEVRAVFDLMDRPFIERQRSYLPSQAVFPLPGEKADQLFAMDIAAETVYAASQALLALLKRLEITPDVVVGHSTGEYSALVAGGAVRYRDESEFIELVLGVNGVFEKLTRAGQVAAGVLLSAGAVQRDVVVKLVAESQGALHLAMENCPNQFVLFGDETAIAKAEAALRSEAALCMRLPFDRAYHTPLFEPFSRGLRDYFQGVTIHAPSVPMYSCATAGPFPSDPAGIRDLMAAQWSSQVRFVDTINALHAKNVRIFVEVGPRGNLTAFVEDILKDRPCLAVASNVHRRGGLVQLQHMLAMLHAHQVRFNPAVLYEHRAARRCNVFGDAPAPSGASRPSRATKIPTVLPRVRLTDAPPMPPVNSPASLPVSVPSTVSDASPGAWPVSSVLATEEPLEETPQAIAWHSEPIAEGPLAEVPIAEEPLVVDGRTAVMSSYFQSMQEFLRTQEDLHQSWLGRGTSLVNEPVAFASDEVSEAAGAPNYPFISEVLSLETGRQAVARCQLDLVKDRFLQDHTLGGRVSDSDPQLLALPVVPLTFSMEMLAEVAALLAPSKVLIGMREIRTYRWIGLDLGSRELVLIAEVKEDRGRDLVVRAKLCDPAASQDQQPRVIVEGDMLLADEYPPAPPVSRLPLAGERPSRWTGQPLYGSFMFHGSSLQAAETVDAWGQDGIISTLRAMPDGPLFADPAPPAFCSDPVTLDAAGQIIGYWTSDHLQHGYHIFPFRLEALELFGPRLTPPERAVCQARIALQGDVLMRSDIDVVDADGQLRMRLIGWWDRRFPMPEPFSQLQQDPRQTLLSSPCPCPPGLLPPTAHVACAIFNCVSPEFLEAHDQIFERVLAYLYLSGRERQQWQALPTQGRRRLEWLAGRIAAKDAVRMLVRQRTDQYLLPADIEIDNDEHGRPFVSRLAAGNLPVPGISLAHTAGTGVAIAAELPAGQRLGIDAEYLRPLEPGFEQVAFSLEERKLLQDLPPAANGAALVKAWCVKEAVAKALGVTNGAVARVATISQFDWQTGSALVRLAGQSAAAPQHARTMAAATLQHGELVVAITAASGGASNGPTNDSL